MTKEQAEAKIRILEAEMRGAITDAFKIDCVKYWYKYVARSHKETFPEWHNDTPENLNKWHRLDTARRAAMDKHITIRTELRKLRRIAGMDTVI